MHHQIVNNALLIFLKGHSEYGFLHTGDNAYKDPLKLQQFLTNLFDYSLLGSTQTLELWV